MIRVTDPSGSDWVVAREWFGLPRWARRETSLDETLQGATDVPVVGDWGGEDGPGIVIAVVVVLAALALFVLLVTFLLPLVFLLVGVLVAGLALGARLLSLAAWTVRAHSADRTLGWRVRGPARSRRAVRAIANALSRGEDPLVDGRRGAEA